MRTLLLLAALVLPSWAVAQPDLEETRPAAIENPEEFLGSVGRAWADLEADTPMPDSGAVTAGHGSVRWDTADDEVKWIQADVRNGYIVQLSVRPGLEVSTADLTRFANELRTDLGRPGPNGYYDATKWSDFRRVAGSLSHPDLKVQVEMFVTDRLMVIRVTPGSEP